MDKINYLLSLSNSLSLKEATPIVEKSFAKIGWLDKKKSMADLSNYVCFHQDLRFGVYEENNKFYLASIKPGGRFVQQTTFQKITEVLTDDSSDSDMEMAKISGATFFSKNTESEKLFLQEITGYDERRLLPLADLPADDAKPSEDSPEIETEEKPMTAPELQLNPVDSVQDRGAFKKIFFAILLLSVVFGDMFYMSTFNTKTEISLFDSDAKVLRVPFLECSSAYGMKYGGASCNKVKIPSNKDGMVLYRNIVEDRDLVGKTRRARAKLGDLDKMPLYEFDWNPLENPEQLSNLMTYFDSLDLEDQVGIAYETLLNYERRHSNLVFLKYFFTAIPLAFLTWILIVLMQFMMKFRSTGLKKDARFKTGFKDNITSPSASFVAAQAFIVGCIPYRKAAFTLGSLLYLPFLIWIPIMFHESVSFMSLFMPLLLLYILLPILVFFGSIFYLFWLIGNFLL